MPTIEPRYLLVLLLACIQVNSQDIEKSKDTSLALYLTATEAYDLWQKNPHNIKIIDVRTPEEYIFDLYLPIAE